MARISVGGSGLFRYAASEYIANTKQAIASTYTSQKFLGSLIGYQLKQSESLTARLL